MRLLVQLLMSPDGGRNGRDNNYAAPEWIGDTGRLTTVRGINIAKEKDKLYYKV